MTSSPQVRASGRPPVSPLEVYLVYRLGSGPAIRAAADDLHAWLAGDPRAYTSTQLLVPVVHVHDEQRVDIAPGAAECQQVVLLGDVDMTQDDAWRAWADRNLGRRAGLSVVVVALEDAPNFAHLSRHVARSSTIVPAGDDEDTRRAHLRLRVSGCIATLLSGPARPPHTLFISYARRDGAGLAEALAWWTLHHMPEHAAFFDRTELAAAEDWDAQFSSAIEHSVLIALASDAYASRYWCAWESLECKQRRRPLVVVDLLQHYQSCSLRYLGNAPVVRWRGEVPVGASDPYGATARPDVDAIVALAPALMGILAIAVRELIRHNLHARWVSRAKEDGVVAEHAVALAYPAELATLPAPGGVSHICVYPDPPLSVSEVGFLREHRPDVTVLSLLQAVAPPRMAGRRSRVALSISDPPGLSDGGRADLERFWWAMNSALLMARHSVAYGGDGRARGYTAELSDIVNAAYDRGLEVPEDAVLLYETWPDTLRSAAPLRALPPSVKVFKVPAPPECGDLRPQDPYWSQDNAPWVGARMRALSSMRDQMREDCTSRVLVGGALRSGVSPVPGLLEEAISFLRAGRPVFVLGGFGGMAGVLAQALAGESPVELTAAWQDDDRARTGLRAQVESVFTERGGAVPMPTDYESQVRELQVVGFGGLRNGLTADENRVLAVTRDTTLAVYLVLRGLAVIRGSPQ